MFPEYDVEVDEDSKLVNVMDRKTKVSIVQLLFDSTEELVSDEFQTLIRDAVRIQCLQDGGGGECREKCREECRAGDDDRQLAGCLSEFCSDADDDVVFVEETYGDAVRAGNVDGSVPWDADDGRGIATIEEDFELALRLQMVEDEAPGRVGVAVGPSHSLRTGIQQLRSKHVEESADAYPALMGPTNSYSMTDVSLGHGSRLHESMNTHTKVDKRRLCTGEKDDFAGLTKLSDVRGLLVDHLKFDERQKVLDDVDRVSARGSSRGISMERMRAMMAKTAKDTAKLSHCERLLRDGPCRDIFSRKSMEKLKKNMLDVGWVNVRDANHLIYRREMPVPSCCGSHKPLVQMTMVACTPSSPHAITKVFMAVYKAEVALYERLMELKRREDDRAIPGKPGTKPGFT
jgi:hypothetical protein